MSETRFDPQGAMDYLKEQITRSWNNLNEKSPLSGLSGAVEKELNGHPSVSQYSSVVSDGTLTQQKMKERIAALNPIMGKARVLFAQSNTPKPIMNLEWMEIRQSLSEKL
jgi:hypothetical protein